jgi:hypothetical protein
VKLGLIKDFHRFGEPGSFGVFETLIDTGEL